MEQVATEPAEARQVFPKAKPILFSAPMVRSILSGAKTQTRRLLKPQPELAIMEAAPAAALASCKAGGLLPDGPIPRWRWRGTFCMPWPQCLRQSPYGCVGDLLWVRETWAPVWRNEYPPEDIRDNRIEYRADTGNKYPGEWPDVLGDDPDCGRWKPSIHMPRWASRITLRITSVRVERLNDITKADAIAEGAHAMLSAGAPYPESAPKWSMQWPHPVELDPVEGHRRCLGSPQMAFANLWNELNGGPDAWGLNPWTWVIGFERVEGSDAETG